MMDMFSCFLQTERAEYTERPRRVGGETQGPGHRHNSASIHCLKDHKLLRLPMMLITETN